ncbi:hypothetical protein AcW1_001060 [Taiwanofungus camphoratus]|nr:hypothetical protein AcW2_000433 [Antrodia cinnamomea]KAI0936959.1 hypothetical protein AcV5_004972 [Antrodia cinnamomea]KAI0964182.1 hypothetical protein AcW1_001060 [Antrodia cinnamomea]
MALSNIEHVDTDRVPSEDTTTELNVSGAVMLSPRAARGVPNKVGVQTRQKRVLPSRSRRGGPGIGSCDIDVMILETLKRKRESEPLVPAGTSFLLTTNSSLVPSSSDSGTFEVELNTQAFGRYFEQPEVQKAYREQQIIQTPEFTQIPEDANVGGRFRPRGAEDESVDTSDATYEKRHRKYETFEKRQRLREKEKLKHEQYKLKERIEQLRGIDASAFLALPASEFFDPVSTTTSTLDVDTSFGESPGSHIHGAAAYNEGERRRKEMLDVASTLEERYRTLLPPDRRFMEKKSSRLDSVTTSTSPIVRHGSSGDEEEDEEEDEVDELIESEVEQKEGKPRPYQDDDGESEVDFEERERQRSKGLKLRIKFPPRVPSQVQDMLSPFMAKTTLLPKSDTRTPIKTTASSFSSASSGQVPVRSSDGKFLSKSKRKAIDLEEGVSLKRPRKKIRANRSAHDAEGGESISAVMGKRPFNISPSTLRPYVSYAGAAGRPERTTCMLMVSALRNAATPTARKTQRHVTAFGTRVPPEIEEVRDFEIPEWVYMVPSPKEPDDWRGSSEGDPMPENSQDGHFDTNGSMSPDRSGLADILHESLLSADADQLAESQTMPAWTAYIE